MMEWHFNPETGCPFWLERAKSLRLRSSQRRARRTTTSTCSATFEDEWLRGGPVRRWVPKGLAGQADLRLRDRRQHRRAEVAHHHRRLPHRLRAVQRHPARTMLSERRELADARPVAARAGCGWPSSTWRSIAAASASARSRSALGHQADQEGRDASMMELYKQHVIDQALTLLKAHDIKCMFTTPKLLEALVREDRARRRPASPASSAAAPR